MKPAGAGYGFPILLTATRGRRLLRGVLAARGAGPASVVALSPVSPARLRRLSERALAADAPQPSLVLLAHRPMGTQD